MKNAVIFDIERNSFVDGPGIRTTVFFKGCNLKCSWCHNPESQSPDLQMMFYKNRCVNCKKCLTVCPFSLTDCNFCGKCEIFCPKDARKICGKEYSTDKVLKEILKDKSFFENSDGGVTFSGGECMLQIDFLTEILKLCKKEGIHTAVDTAGCVGFENFEKILPFTDLFLYDIKAFDPKIHKQYVGVDNLLILENLKKLFAKNANVWIRIPVIGGVNDNIEEMKNIRCFLDNCGKPQKIELLRYHAMGENKYIALGKPPVKFPSISDAKMDELKKVFA